MLSESLRLDQRCFLPFRARSSIQKVGKKDPLVASESLRFKSAGNLSRNSGNKLSLSKIVHGSFRKSLCYVGGKQGSTLMVLKVRSRRKLA